MSSAIERCLHSRTLLWAITILFWPPFLLLATYRSFEPTVLGMWSRRLFAVIAAYGLLLLVVTIAAILTRTKKSSWLLKQARRNYFTMAFAVGLPAIGWLLLLCGVIVIEPAAELMGRISWALFDLMVIVFLLETFFLLADRKPKQRRAISVRLLAVGLGVFFAITVVEILGVVLEIEPLQRCTVNRPNLDVRWQNEEFDIRIVTNDQGLREPHHIEANHPGKYRVIVVGDSMTFGHGVNYQQTYPYLAQQQLQDEYDRRDIEIVNVSRQGAGPREYLQYLRDCIPQWKPDLIVLGFYTGNDNPVQQPYIPRTEQQLQTLYDEIVNDNRPHFLMRSVVCRLLYRKVLKPLGRAASSASTRSVPGKVDPIFSSPNPIGLLKVGGNMSSESQQRYNMLDKQGWIEKGLQYKVNPGLLRSVIRRPTAIADTMLLREETRQDMLAEWELTQRVLTKIIEASRDCDADFMLIAIPHAYQVDSRSIDQLVEWDCFTTPEMLKSRKVNELIVQFCKQQNVHCLDPLGRYRRETAAGKQLFFPIDSHFTPTGHVLLAEELSAAILKKHFDD